MNKLPYYNDQAHIAEEFHFIDEHTSQTARLAFFKINSYKLSLIKASFSTSREDLSAIIKATLLNYTDSAKVLANLGYFNGANKN
ncbi:MAG: hypothetical protein H7Y42_15860 [Chitinophagaceae bacterium]|nr:hypothetical protein [Chitinophagaceae bacterium]